MTPHRSVARRRAHGEIEPGSGPARAAAADRLLFRFSDHTSGAEVCVGRDVTATTRPQLHDDVELRWINRGRMRVAGGGVSHLLTAGTAALVPAHLLHAWTPVDGEACSFLAMHLSAQELARLRGANDAALLATGQVGADACATTADDIETLLGWAARLYVQAQSRSASGVPSIDRAVSYLRQHYAQKISLDELAIAARLSKFHFLRLFAATLGTTPHRYQMLVRVARARYLLRTNVSLAEVALQTGFFDQSHFTRCFHEVVGVTPGRYALDMATPLATRH